MYTARKNMVLKGIKAFITWLLIIMCIDILLQAVKSKVKDLLTKLNKTNKRLIIHSLITRQTDHNTVFF